MAFKSGKATVHSVGGIRGLAVRFTGAEETKRALAMLPAAIQRRVLRSAVAAAARPVTSDVRAGAKSYSAASKRHEGIGTTARAIVQKVATSKRDKSVAYALVGARRGYTEFVSLVDEQRRSPVSGITVQRTSKRGRRSQAKVTRRDLKNLGPVARKARLDPKSNSTRKRSPTRTLHLQELGGKKRKIRAGRFMEQAARSQVSASRANFARVLDAGIQREFSRMAAK